MPNVVTANRLIDGIVVYLAPDGGWVEELARASSPRPRTRPRRSRAKLPRPSPSASVVAVYPMEVALNDGVPVDPLSVRERIRASHRTTLTKDWYDVPL